MSKNLVVYYSLEGNTKHAAEKIKEKLGADLLKLVPKKAYHDKGFAKFFWGGKSAVMAEKPELESISVDPSGMSVSYLVFRYGHRILLRR